PPRPRPSSSRDDEDAGACDDFADLDRAYPSRGAGALPCLRVRGRHSDEKTSRRLRVKKERAKRVIDALEADSGAVIEIRTVSFESAEADPALRVAPRAGEKRHETGADPHAYLRLFRHLVS